jgi:hypothetical protein
VRDIVKALQDVEGRLFDGLLSVDENRIMPVIRGLGRKAEAVCMQKCIILHIFLWRPDRRHDKHARWRSSAIASGSATGGEHQNVRLALQLDDDDFDDLARAHRDAHHLCGVGATLGFVGTGKVARTIEQILLAAVKSGRTLNDDEVPVLRAGIALLRSTANAEMQAAP